MPEPEPKQHPVVAGLVALVGVGLAIGLLAGGGPLVATRVRGLGAAATATDDFLRGMEIMLKAEASFERCEFAVSSDAVLQLVARSNCTAYDCEFVALAHAEGVQLVTTDRQILHEFPEVAISLEKFVQD